MRTGITLDKDQILEHLSLRDIYGDDLKKTAKGYKMRCPFHDETEASFHVFEGDKKFHCYGCQKSGSAFDYVMHVKGTDFPDALRYLARTAGMELPGTSVPKKNGGNGNGEKPAAYTQAAKPAKEVKVQHPVKPREHGSVEHRLTCHNRLLKKEAALKNLTEKRQIDVETIKEYQLGLSQPYEIIELKERTGMFRMDALVCPIRQRDGGFASNYYYYNIPDVTQHPVDINGWGGKGMSPTTYYSDAVKEQHYLFVCEGMKDLFRLKTALRDVKWAKDFVFISSTHGSAIPEEWKAQEFWRRWDVVYCGQDSDPGGERIAFDLAKYTGQVPKRVKLPADKPVDHKDWTDYFNNGGTVEQFKSLLDNAQSVVESAREKGIKLTDEKPLDNLTLAYHNGHLYYTFTCLCQDTQTDTVIEQYETYVLKSDGKKYMARESTCKAGTPEEEKAWRLGDGTLIEKKPRMSKHARWSVSSILEFCAKKQKCEPTTRPLVELIRDVREHLRGAVWFPDEDNYTLLAVTGVVTFCQEIFDSVPLLFMNGAAGTGKSQTGRAMNNICCNSVLSGKISAATLTRLIDGSRGFVVIDDLETITARKDDGLFSDIVQILKVSYNKETSRRQWTDVSGTGYAGKELNFYGVKLMNNTRGVDNVLGTRMLHLNTFPIPNDIVRAEFLSRPRWTLLKLNVLRDELYTWAFSNVRLIEDTYRKCYTLHTERQEEITAPLIVLAELAGDRELTESLNRALEKQNVVNKDMFDPIDTMKEAAASLVRQGHSWISITQVILEMRSMFDPHFGQHLITEVPEWARPEWVGRTLRQQRIVDYDTEGKRTRLWGKFVTILPVNEDYISETLGTNSDGTVLMGSAEALSFCRGCNQCPYKAVNCDIMPRRMAAEG